MSILLFIEFSLLCFPVILYLVISILLVSKEYFDVRSSVTLLSKLYVLLVTLDLMLDVRHFYGKFYFRFVSETGSFFSAFVIIRGRLGVMVVK